MCDMSLLGSSKYPGHGRGLGVICFGLIWGGCLMCDMSLLGSSKHPGHGRGLGVICFRLIWGDELLRGMSLLALRNATLRERWHRGEGNLHRADLERLAVV